MRLRFTIGVCTAVMVLSSVSLCRPPTPRIVQAEGPAQAASDPEGALPVDLPIAMDREQQVIRVV